MRRFKGIPSAIVAAALTGVLTLGASAHAFALERMNPQALNKHPA